MTRWPWRPCPKLLVEKSDESSRIDSNSDQKRSCQPAALPPIRRVGRRGLCRGFPEHGRLATHRGGIWRASGPVPVQRHLAKEEELGAGESALPQRMGV